MQLKQEVLLPVASRLRDVQSTSWQSASCPVTILPTWHTFSCALVSRILFIATHVMFPNFVTELALKLEEED